MRMHDEEDLPVLSAVVRGGDESIIRGLRMGRETLEAIESLRHAALADGVAAPVVPQPGGALPDVLPDALPDASPDALPDALPGPLPGAGDGSPVYLHPETLRPVTSAPRCATHRDVARAFAGHVDILLERPVDVARRELRELLQGTGLAAAPPSSPA